MSGSVILRRMSARGGLLSLAFAHTWAALFFGLQDGDFSLLWVAAPFVLLTALRPLP